MTSPAVWAGPISMSWTCRSPTRRSSWPVKVRGRDELDAVEMESAEDVEQERAEVAHVGGGPHERGEHRGGQLGHLGRRGGRGDDLGPGGQGIAVALVTVGRGC
jgi:hypothetical protein